MIFEDKRIGVFMKIYRNEQTMYRAIDSILKQTYRNFKLYILVNEKTKPVVKEHVENDARVELIDGGPTDGFTSNLKYIANDGNAFVTPIDADDWLADKYFEEMISFASKYGTDITAVGNFFINEKEEKVGIRQQKQLVYDIQDLGKNFAPSYAFFRTAWGKLYNSKLLVSYDGARLPEIECYGGYGGDTLFVLDILREAKSIGICEKVLYYYQNSSTSSSGWFEKGRLDSDDLLLRYAENVLKELGGLSNQNYLFLRAVYGEALLDTIRLLLRTQMEESQRIKYLLYLFKKSSINEFVLLNHNGMLRGNNATYIDRMRGLIFDNRKDVIEKSGLGKEYLELLKILYPNIEEKTNDKIIQIDDIAGTYPELGRLIEENRLDDALQFCMNTFDKSSEVLYALELIDVWIALATKLENAALFVFGMQLKVELLCDADRIDEAIRVYKELERLKIQDDNMIYLKERLENQ